METPTNHSAAPAVKEMEEEERLSLIRDSIISYLIDPQFGGGKDFLEKLGVQDIDLQTYFSDIGLLCFTMEQGRYKGKEESFAHLLIDIHKVHFAHSGEADAQRFVNADRNETMQLNVDGHKLSFNGVGKYLFATDSKNLLVKPDQPLVYPRGSTIYDPTPSELTDFLTNKSIYGGYEWIKNPGDEKGSVTVNYGTRVAKPGEPSLTRLVGRLINEKDTDETKAQKILDFVTRGISYSHRDVEFGKRTKMQLVKRPNEVLMTGEGDCTSKSLLLASLYEQAGVDYRLIYMLPNETRTGHLTNLVAGNFGNGNGMECTIGDRHFSIAESTAHGFAIGKTKTEESMTVADMTYIQKPSEQEVIDAQTGKVVREKAPVR